MKVLWFSVTPSLYSSYTNTHNGGGWISSLERVVRRETEITLSIAFISGKESKEEKIDNVSYFLIAKDSDLILEYKRLINTTKPDIIQIFGSENDFGKICNHTKIPVVIHMQGSIPPYHNALFPIGMNTYDFIFGKGLSWRRRLMGLLSERSFRKRAEKEIAIIQSCKYFMGRTDWDRSLVALFNPNAKYFHQEEALRDSFLQNIDIWKYKEPKNKIKIVSVISNPWYKGIDLVLKTAKLLTQFSKLSFEWNIYGVSDIRFFEKKYKIRASDVNVNIKGCINKDTLVNVLINSNCYVHPSYIDNSPNSICEAQIMGLPILATNVGGISSIIKDRENGILFPANDPYTLATLINEIIHNKDLSEYIGSNALALAKKRHNTETIKHSLLSHYKAIIKHNKSISK